MYLGKERRNRFVALGLAAVLIAGVVLALLATVAAAAPPAGGALGSLSGSPSAAPPAGHHDAVDFAQPGAASAGHPETP